MDEADRRMLYYLDLNSRAPVKKIASLAGVRAEAAETRLNALMSKGIVKRCYPEIDRAKLGYYPFKVYLQLQSVVPEKITEIYQYLSSLPNIGWAVTCSGRWDMIFAVWARNVEEFNDLYETFLSRYHKCVLGKVISLTVEIYLANKKWLYEEGQKSDIVRVGGVPNRVIDDSDAKVLRQLGMNGRATVIEISQKTCIPPEEVEQRIKDMQKKGVILSFRTDLNLGEFERTFCKSFVYLTKSSKEEEARLLEYCYRHPDVTSIVRCVGPWDMEIEAHSRSFEEFTDMMNDIRNRYPNMVRNFEAVVISQDSGMRYAPREAAANKSL